MFGQRVLSSCTANRMPSSTACWSEYWLMRSASSKRSSIPFSFGLCSSVVMHLVPPDLKRSVPFLFPPDLSCTGPLSGTPEGGLRFFPLLGVWGGQLFGHDVA